MVDAVCVDPSIVEKIWPKVSQFIKSAMQRGDLGFFADIEDDVLNGDALLWLAYQQPIIQAAAVTQISMTERGKVCTIVACGGAQRERWIFLLADIERYAKKQGCRAVRLMGRKGWKRILKNYSQTKIVLERRL